MVFLLPERTQQYNTEILQQLQFPGRDPKVRSEVFQGDDSESGNFVNVTGINIIKDLPIVTKATENIL